VSPVFALRFSSSVPAVYLHLPKGKIQHSLELGPAGKIPPEAVAMLHAHSPNPTKCCIKQIPEPTSHADPPLGVVANTPELRTHIFWKFRALTAPSLLHPGYECCPLIIGDSPSQICVSGSLLLIRIPTIGFVRQSQTGRRSLLSIAANPHLTARENTARAFLVRCFLYHGLG